MLDNISMVNLQLVSHNYAIQNEIFLHVYINHVHFLTISSASLGCDGPCAWPVIFWSASSLQLSLRPPTIDVVTAADHQKQLIQRLKTFPSQHAERMKCVHMDVKQMCHIGSNLFLGPLAKSGSPARQRLVLWQKQT